MVAPKVRGGSRVWPGHWRQHDVPHRVTGVEIGCSIRSDD